MKWALAHLSCSAGHFLKAACSTDKLGPPEYVWPLGDLLMSEAAIIHTFHTFVVSFPWLLLRICQPSYGKIHHSWFFSLHSKSIESERDTQHQTHWSRYFIRMITQEEHWVCQSTEKKPYMIYVEGNNYIHVLKMVDKCVCQTTCPNST